MHDCREHTIRRLKYNISGDDLLDFPREALYLLLTLTEKRRDMCEREIVAPFACDQPLGRTELLNLVGSYLL